MVRVSMIVCVLSMCLLAHGDDYGLPPVLIQCRNCMGAIPVGAFVRMMCRYPDASPGANFLVLCPDKVVWHDGAPGFTVTAREIDSTNVCPPTPISGLCSE